MIDIVTESESFDGKTPQGCSAFSHGHDGGMRCVRLSSKASHGCGQARTVGDNDMARMAQGFHPRPESNGQPMLTAMQVRAPGDFYPNDALFDVESYSGTEPESHFGHADE